MRIIEPSVMIALEKGYFEIAELLINHPNFDVNCFSCYNYKYSFDFNKIYNILAEKTNISIARL